MCAKGKKSKWQKELCLEETRLEVGGHAADVTELAMEDNSVSCFNNVSGWHIDTSARLKLLEKRKILLENSTLVLQSNNQRKWPASFPWSIGRKQKIFRSSFEICRAYSLSFHLCRVVSMFIRDDAKKKKRQFKPKCSV